MLVRKRVWSALQQIGGGLVGCVVGVVGAGAFVPPVVASPQTTDAEVPVEESGLGISSEIKRKQVRCREPGSNACVDQCADIGAYCPALATHPYSPSSGTGELHRCTNDSSTEWTCSFRYKNGDSCTLLYPSTHWICVYRQPTPERTP